MKAADPFRQGSVPPSLPLMSWWSSLHFCQDQSLFFASAEAARADMKRIIAIVMHCDARMLKLAMLNGLKLWVMNMNISQCITHPQHPRIPWGPMPCRWSWCSLEPSWFGTWSPQWHNGIPLLAWSLHFSWGVLNHQFPSFLLSRTKSVSCSSTRKKVSFWFFAQAIRGEETPHAGQDIIDSVPTVLILHKELWLSGSGGAVYRLQHLRSWEAGFISQQRRDAAWNLEWFEVRSFKACHASCTSTNQSSLFLLEVPQLSAG